MNQNDCKCYPFLQWCPLLQAQITRISITHRVVKIWYGTKNDVIVHFVVVIVIIMCVFTQLQELGLTDKQVTKDEGRGMNTWDRGITNTGDKVKGRGKGRGRAKEDRVQNKE